jgi:hypothetical protein
MSIPNKRKDFTDSQIMDALDASEYNITKAAKLLTVNPQYLYKWVRDDDNLKGYLRMRVESDAVKARDKLNEILELANALDPKQMGHVVQICKILLDKQEADKQQLDIHTQHSVDEELNEKIKKLLGNE